tara:strand:+ start:351 stop:716 length:366 start_codon:yes stop_codon:yes gene_type:complete
MKKVYGESRIDTCPFCDNKAFLKNEQGIPVCKDHKKSLMEVKCVCGEYLEPKEGKYGSFFTCINCGIITKRKAKEMATFSQDKPKVNKSAQKETTPEPSPEIHNPKEEKYLTPDEVDMYFT